MGGFLAVEVAVVAIELDVVGYLSKMMPMEKNWWYHPVMIQGIDMQGFHQ